MVYQPGQQVPLSACGCLPHECLQSLQSSCTTDRRSLPQERLSLSATELGTKEKDFEKKVEMEQEMVDNLRRDVGRLAVLNALLATAAEERENLEVELEGAGCAGEAQLQLLLPPYPALPIDIMCLLYVVNSCHITTI
jgi:hypothetical protein